MPSQLGSSVIISCNWHLFGRCKILDANIAIIWVFLITDRILNMGEVNVFTGVCLSTGGPPSEGGVVLKGVGETPPPEIWSTSCRYASYWNAILF